MKITRSFVQMIAITGLLVSGISAYAQATNAPAPRPGGGGGGGRGAEAQLHQMIEQLNLTAEQQPKVKAVLEERTKKVTELRSDSTIPREQLRSKMQAIEEETNHKLQAILTPEQFKKYEAWHAQRGRRGPATGESTNHVHTPGQ